MSRKSKHCAWKARQRRSLSESVERLEDRRLLAADIGDAYGRKPVDANDWPFVVGFVSSGSVGCGGTLIAPNAVLTAAHCVADGETDQTAVLVGSQRIQVLQKIKSSSTLSKHE